MTRIKYFLAFICVASIFSSSLTAAAQGWEELKGEHFIVYYLRNEQFAKDVLYRAEEYYKNIAADLGYPRYSEFWLWEKRVKIINEPRMIRSVKTSFIPHKEV